MTRAWPLAAVKRLIPASLRRKIGLLIRWGPTLCPACGHYARMRRLKVLWEELGAEWELTPALYEQMDQREGELCSVCGSNARVRQLAEVLLSDLRGDRQVACRSIAGLAGIGAMQNTRIAEINAVSGVHPFLATLPGLHYSEYGSPDPHIRSEDLSNLSYPNDYFDYVLTSDTLEHVPDFDRALAEVRRVLKPGGKHIFNIPVIWDRKTRRRAEFADGEIRHLLKPSYHAGPAANQSDYLVFNEFGSDVVQRIERAGFNVSVVKSPGNPLVSTFVARRLT